MNGSVAIDRGRIDAFCICVAAHSLLRRDSSCLPHSPFPQRRLTDCSHPVGHVLLPWCLVDRRSESIQSQPTRLRPTATGQPATTATTAVPTAAAAAFLFSLWSAFSEQLWSSRIHWSRQRPFPVRHDAAEQPNATEQPLWRLGRCSGRRSRHRYWWRRCWATAVIVAELWTDGRGGCIGCADGVPTRIP